MGRLSRMAPWSASPAARTSGDPLVGRQRSDARRMRGGRGGEARASHPTSEERTMPQPKQPVTDDSIQVRQLSHYQFTWVAGDAAKPGTWTLQLVLDQGAWEEVL